MDPTAFRNSLAAESPPAVLSGALQALWWDAKGDWEQAHRSAQQDPTEAGAAVHAYLHRKEGDLANAAFWYRRAGTEPQAGPIEAEGQRLLAALLNGTG